MHGFVMKTSATSKPSNSKNCSQHLHLLPVEILIHDLSQGQALGHDLALSPHLDRSPGLDQGQEVKDLAQI